MSATTTVSPGLVDDLLRRTPAEMVSPDSMGAVAAHVEREYGYGYRIGIVSAGWTGGATYLVRASDGSRFLLSSDRYGNVSRIEAQS